MKTTVIRLFCSTFLLGSLLAFPAQAHAQAFVLGNTPAFTPLNLSVKKTLDDKVLLEVRYHFTWTYAGDTQSHSEQRTMLVGRNHVYTRNEPLYQNDSVSTSLMSKGAKGVALYANPTVAFEVWTNRQTKAVEVGYRVPFDKMVLSFDIPDNKLQWTFDDEKQTVLGYTCAKATTTYRGRSVTAWFAEELPYDAGPYCFSGLPGLIMKVELEGASWQAIGLRKGRDGEQIYSYGRPIQKMPREKAIGFLANLYNDPVATYSSLGVECSSANHPDEVLAPGSMKWAIPALLMMEQ